MIDIQLFQRATALVLSSAVSFFACQSVSAQHFDVGLAADSGKVVTGSGNALLNEVEVGQRIFESDVERVAAPSAFSQFAPGEPGHVAVNQTDLDADNPPPGSFQALPGGAAVNFASLPITIGSNTRNLFYWDASGAVDFQPVSSTTELSWQVDGGGDLMTINGSDAGVVGGFLLDTTDNTAGFVGELHRHVLTTIDDTSAAAAPVGIYLLSIEYDAAGLEAADPAYFLFAALSEDDFAGSENVEDRIEDAEDWVADNLLGSNAAIGAPEPSSAMLVVLAVLGSATLRRRRRRAAA